MISDQKLPVLYGGPTSPFARMTKLYGDHLGVDYTYESIDVYDAEFLDELNPLRQIPTLSLGDGQAIFDSRTIFTYFEKLAKIDVSEVDFGQLTRISLALGMTDACLQYRIETTFPKEVRNQARISKSIARMARSVLKLEERATDIISGELRLEQIVVACSLEYLDFRYTKNWRGSCKSLAQWMEQFSDRVDMIETRPVA